MSKKSDSQKDSIQILLSCMQHLGSPSVAPTDIAWAADLPAGKALIDWLARQILQDSDVHISCIYGPHGEDARVQSALGAIALDDEELRDLIRAERLGFHPSENQAACPPQYVSPATFRTRAKYTEEETGIIEEETRLLKHRLEQATLASRQISQLIKSLQATIVEVERDGHQRQEHLSELSVQTDTSIARSTDIAKGLLKDLASAAPIARGKHHKLAGIPGDASNSINTYKDELTSLSALRTEIVGAAEKKFYVVEEAEQALPSRDELQREAARLQAAFRPSRTGAARDKGPSDREVLLSAAYDIELEKMCQQLEDATDRDRADVLQSMTTQPETATADVALSESDVASELSRAWRLDQATLLTAREDVLDQIKWMLEAQLIPLLTALHSRLSATRTAIEDAEVLVSAFLEELEAVADDVAAAQARSATGKSGKTAPEALLEAELIDLLKRRQDLRASDAPPLVLLDPADLTSELASLSARADAAVRAEDAWLATLPARLSELSRSHAPLLSAVYANAPMNTAPPFSASPALAALEADARARADALGEAVVRLQKECELSGRDKRKLNAFVEKWGRG